MRNVWNPIAVVGAEKIMSEVEEAFVVTVAAESKERLYGKDAIKVASSEAKQNEFTAFLVRGTVPEEDLIEDKGTYFTRKVFFKR